MKSKLIQTFAIVYIITFIMSGIALFATACSLPADVPAQEQASVDASCDEFMKNQHISKTVEVADSGSVTVTLCSNPTTGFQWTEQTQINDETILMQTGYEFLSPESDPPPPPGTPGQAVWTFKALKKGTTEVSMEYSQPWEGGEKEEWTFILTITIE